MTAGRSIARRAALVATALSLHTGACEPFEAEHDPPGPVDPGDPPGPAGKTYRVGPARVHTSLADVVDRLEPGDVVEVDGDATYRGTLLHRAGTAARPIHVRGVRVNGRRPVLAGGSTTLEISGDHTVFEGFEVTGGEVRCILHHAAHVTIRDALVHGCPAHGILSSDTGSGSLLLDYVEVYDAGSGSEKHPIYIATDETLYPGSVFRMQHSYVHDNRGGNNVKSRAERNELFANWIEGAIYKEIDLVGPDGQDPDLAREHADVVGNVFRKTSATYVARVGGDGTGETYGRYRFVNNTFLIHPDSLAAIHLADGIESVELHNNVFYAPGGGAVRVFVDEAAWPAGTPVMVGSNNALPPGSAVPAGWAATFVGPPGFVDADALDLRLSPGSALVDAGNRQPASPPGHPFPSPRLAPRDLPPSRSIEPVRGARPRPDDGRIDVGAFELAPGG
jgi:hypothetical protein